MMRVVKILAVAIVAITLAAPPAHANYREIHVDYFTDGNLNNQVGGSIVWCDDTTDSWGTLAGEYIGHYEINCSTGEVFNVSLYHWNGGGWDPVECYYD